jgi:hypothetical protein
MTAPTQFGPAQLAVLAEARALGGWEVHGNGRIFRASNARDPWKRFCCVAREVGIERGWGDGDLWKVLGLKDYSELEQIFNANDDPTDPRRPALLRELGMEVT